ncbi:FAD-dependent 2-octaprenylphenol hydroxylase [Vibrio ulleungensis]|uniref:FAD-dependent 2-octaprenylphenol hydroxylase n=1 Tax=Vibrio ulleungensis TaxID=2807619 RepID=A0ABS2HP01_9VIBR|nr:FAD-dependent 2-octaprenylphenol hydroxylase [Vibrio ulleungensis]MBM7037913.1 FAD-dependent 2-octaprenylphenol hydroxylase [Vibrio ulleungensis]
MMNNVDVAVIGGGMVGLTLALALKPLGLRVAVIESQDLDTPISNEPDSRVSALSRASENIFRNLGVWAEIEASRVTAYQAMEVWEQDSFAKIEFDAMRMSPSNLGYIAENQIITHALYQQVKRESHITLFSQTKCQSLNMGESEAWLMLDNGQGLTAKLVVGADGANSWIRKQQDIPLTHWDYGHTAIVANVRTTEPHQRIARQAFTPQGPLAFLPLHQSHLSSIVWSVDSQKAERLMSVDDDEFEKSLTAEFDAKLGMSYLQSPRRAFPLTMRYARDFVVERVALVGDAAHTIHPLAGQGVNLGLLDAAALAQELASLVDKGKDIGSKANLRQYERWRKAEAAKMIAAMQGFKDLFEGDNPAKKLIRGIGMSLAGQLPGAKHEIMNRALGLKGELPNLAKGVLDPNAR